VRACSSTARRCVSGAAESSPPRCELAGRMQGSLRKDREPTATGQRSRIAFANQHRTSSAFSQGRNGAGDESVSSNRQHG